VSAPGIWIVFPIIAAIPLFLFRKRYWVVCIIQTGICASLSLIAAISQFSIEGDITFLGAQISPSLGILGRLLLIEPNYKMVILAFNIFLGIWTFSLYIHQIESYLVPLGLVFNSLLISTISISPFLYSGLVLEIAVIVSIPILVGRTEKKFKGISRYLINFSVGMVFILLAGWYLAGGEISPINDEQLIQATLILGLGFVFWLAVFPVHTWIPILSEEISPVNSFYVLILLPLATMILLLKYLNGFSWLRSFPIVFDALALFGSTMCFTGAILTVFQKNIRRAAGYLFLYSSGVILIAISLSTSNGYLLVTHLFLLRFIVLTMLAWMVVLLESKLQDQDIRHFEGSFFEFPIIISGLIVSIFSLIGMPLTPGFPIMQALIASVSETNTVSATILLVSMLLLSVHFIRWIYFFTKSEYQQRISFEDKKILFFTAGFFLICLVAGLFPSKIYSAFETIISGYEFLVQ